MLRGTPRGHQCVASVSAFSKACGPPRPVDRRVMSTVMGKGTVNAWCAEDNDTCRIKSRTPQACATEPRRIAPVTHRGRKLRSVLHGCDSVLHGRWRWHGRVIDRWWRLALGELDIVLELSHSLGEGERFRSR